MLPASQVFNLQVACGGTAQPLYSMSQFPQFIPFHLSICTSQWLCLSGESQSQLIHALGLESKFFRGQDCVTFTTQPQNMVQWLVGEVLGTWRGKVSNFWTLS
jgi:hypothetical protein